MEQKPNIVLYFRRTSPQKVFPLSENAGRSGTPLTAPSGEGQRVRGANLPNLGSLGHQGTGGIFVAPKVANTLSARYAKDGSENLIQLNDDGGSQVNRIYSPDGISPTVPTACGGGHIPKISAHVADGSAVPGPQSFGALRLVRTEEAKKVRSESMKNGKDYTPFGKGFRTLDECFEQVTGAVTGALNRDTLVGNETDVRRLTPRECERLQGFPDDWTAILSDTQRYKCLGNAVTVPVIEFLALSLWESLQ